MSHRLELNSHSRMDQLKRVKLKQKQRSQNIQGGSKPKNGKRQKETIVNGDLKGNIIHHPNNPREWRYWEIIR